MTQSFGEELILRTATNDDREQVKNLVFGVLAEYGLCADKEGTDADLDDIEANYLGRGGTFDVIENADGEIVGSIGLYPLDADTVELRKMYFALSIRGRGLGRQLLERTINTARQMGYRRVFLETASKLKEAVHLYETFGFRPVDEKHTPRCDQAYLLDLQDERVTGS